MRSDGSNYEALGLKPGADAAAIDRAYRRLIKLHHPDREGGDSDRAAEINRAYSALRKPVEQASEKVEPANVAEAIYARRAQLRRPVQPPKRRTRVWPLLVIAAALVAYLKGDDISYHASQWWSEASSKLELASDSGASGPGAPMGIAILDSELQVQAIDEAVERAAALGAAENMPAMVDASRDCHRDLRADPTIERLDRCAAFDDAVLEIQHHDVVYEDGYFSASPVTARQMSAAKLLSDDYVAIEARLDRVRTRVQRMLAPPEPEPSYNLGVPQTAP